MYHLELTVNEMTVLKETLESHVEDMKVELAHTDTHHFKEMLKRRLDLLERIVSRLAPDLQKVAF
jgi:hypothetical protein